MWRKTDTISRIIGAVLKFFKIEKQIAAVEINGDIIKVVEALGPAGARTIIRINEAVFSRQHPEALSEAIKKLFAGNSPAGRVVVLNIPRHNFTARYAKLPSTDEEEIGKIGLMESLKYIPYNAEDIICGYRVVEKTSDGYSYVQLAAAESDMIKALVHAAENAGLAVRSARSGSEALFAWFLHVHAPGQNEIVLVVSVDSNYIDIVVIEGSKLTYTRGVSCHLSMAVDAMAKQIKLSADDYYKDSLKKIDKIFLTGLVEKAAQLEKALGVFFAIPITSIDQALAENLSAEARITLSNASFAGLLGIVWNEDKMKINLMPENACIFFAPAALKKGILVTTCLVLAVCLALTGLVMKKFHNKVMTLAYINSELKKMDPRINKMRKMLDDMEQVKQASSGASLAIDVLSDCAATGQGVLITMLSYERQKSFTVRGTAPSMNEAFSYTAALGKSPVLRNVRTRYVTKSAAAYGDMIDFEITGNISKGK
jgi:Tfp pilus assembly PilM family ATPase/Tfp pilus assembly protein PilN